MRTKLIVAVAAIALAVVAPAALSDAVAGCDKSHAKAGAETASASGTGCSKSAKAAQVADGRTNYGCPKAATRAAMVALQKHADTIDCETSKAMIAEAVAQAEEAEKSMGCEKSRAAAAEAALVAMKEAADKTGCPEAQAAVNEAQHLLAMNDEPTGDDSAVN